MAMYSVNADREDVQESHDPAEEGDIEQVLTGDFQHVHFAAADAEQILEANEP
jgi:hypothetical protein